MKRSRTVLAVLAIATSALLASDVAAWESECRPADAAGMFGGRNADPARSICAGGEPMCEGGLEYARGVQMGEHTSLTRQAMLRAGLGDFRTKRAFPNGYYTDGTNALDGDGESYDTMQPARFGRMNRLVTRATNIPELAQVPDGSHSFGDFVLGNEHCLVPNLPSGDAAKVEACHTFNPHMGSVNSTHFLPQAKAIYLRYHLLAVDVAERCKEMQDAFDAVPMHPLADLAQTAVEECETQALAYEAVGSHFLADAWSTGHMWQRWGRPVGSVAPRNRLREATVGAFAGIIHGWRSVVRDFVGDADITHDQLCMPGPFEDETDVVRYRSGADEYHRGGGDLYLLQCNAKDQDSEWAVSTGSALSSQYNRMLSCMATGFQEVYQAGPKTAGDAMMLPGGDPAVQDVSGDECWDQRVTNDAFVMGMGLSDAFSLADPGLIVRIVLRVIQGDQASGLEGVDDLDVMATGRHLRFQLAQLAYQARTRGSAQPNETDLADLEHRHMRSLLGSERNQDNLRTTLLFDDDVNYYEMWKLSQWPTPVGISCTTDADCVPGDWCDDTRSDDPQCLPIEAASMRAYRLGMLPDWCGDIGAEELDDMRAQCALLGGGEACDACVDVLLPHVRNACDETSWSLHTDTTNRRSLCDVLNEGGLGYVRKNIYLNYDPDDATSARAAVRELCLTSPSDRPLDPEEEFWVPKVDPTSVELSSTNPTATLTVDTVGEGPELDWTVEAPARLSATPMSFSEDAGVQATVEVSSTDLTTPFFGDVEIYNECHPELRDATRVAIEKDQATLIDFEDLPQFGAVAGDRYATEGLTLASDAVLYGVEGDDSIGSFSICGSTNSNDCDSDVTMTFSPPISSVSFYVGDQDLDYEGTFDIVVTDDSGQVIESLATNYDRRFYTFSGDSIETVDFSASSEWELLDSIYFIPQP